MQWNLALNRFDPCKLVDEHKVGLHDSLPEDMPYSLPIFLYRAEKWLKAESTVRWELD